MKKYCQIACFAALSWLTACNRGDFQSPTLLVPAPQVVTADAETPPVPALTGQDAADDPAIWYNAAKPEKSAIIGTVKKFGLEVYDLKGQLLHSIRTGNPNNVDIRNGFVLNNGQIVDLAVCSDRSTNEVLVFRIHPADASLTLISGGRIKSAMTEVYGICLYRHQPSGQLYVFVNGKDGSVEQYEIKPFEQEEVTAVQVRTFKLATQPEGMVCDDRLGLIYMGEEDKGVWKMQAAPTAPAQPVLLKKSGADNTQIKFDIEGMSLYFTGDTTGYLVVSSQGNNSYAVFDRSGGNRYIGSFVVGDGAFDGSAETDGLDICTRPLPPLYPAGLLVVQDGFNKDPQGKGVPQNFKLVSWTKVEKAIQAMR